MGKRKHGRRNKTSQPQGVISSGAGSEAFAGLRDKVKGARTSIRVTCSGEKHSGGMCSMPLTDEQIAEGWSTCGHHRDQDKQVSKPTIKEAPVSEAPQELSGLDNLSVNELGVEFNPDCSREEAIELLRSLMSPHRFIEGVTRPIEKPYAPAPDFVSRPDAAGYVDVVSILEGDSPVRIKQIDLLKRVEHLKVVNSVSRDARELAVRLIESAELASSTSHATALAFDFFEGRLNVDEYVARIEQDRESRKARSDAASDRLTELLAARQLGEEVGTPNGGDPAKVDRVTEMRKLVLKEVAKRPLPTVTELVKKLRESFGNDADDDIIQVMRSVQKVYVNAGE